MDATGSRELAGRSVDQLSGGQRQRVWIAMTLTQETPVMLLDELTTHLDVAHQGDALDALAEFNEADDRTLVIVLHDLLLVCRYAHNQIALREGKIVAEGPLTEIVTEQLVQAVFALQSQIIADPVSATPLVVPISATGR
ncbi:ATP-binding cassette domain-containing protein [Euzebya tangerina]|uniref:ABC transporter ATP-binding protein n=1 Tax=Euzebya tangerina TaxID=591198 RepID=UPI00196A4D8F